MNLLKKIKSIITPPEIIDERKIECAIDDESVPCETFSEPYVGVPSPEVLQSDPWFGDPTKSERQLAYEKECAELNDDLQDGWWLRDSLDDSLWDKNGSRESSNIHQEMYELSTKNWTTVAETQGGSENFQEGPGGWNSGTGMAQFK